MKGDAFYELTRVLETGCPEEHMAALLREIADRFELLRVLAERKQGNRGTARLAFVWPVVAGCPLIPQDVAPRPLLTTDP